MKGKNTSKQARINRMLELANIEGTKNIQENKKTTLGTLISYKKADNGINYGIIKENKNYYIKKGNKKQEPDVSDFTYIGGLANKTDYQYGSLSEADKNMNMVLQSINEANSMKLNNKSSKMILEQKEEMEIEKAEDALEKAEEKVEDEGGEEFPEPELPKSPEPDEFPEPEEAPEKEETPEPEEAPEKDTSKDDIDDINIEDLGLDDETPEETEDEPEETEDEPKETEDEPEEDLPDEKGAPDDTEINLMKSKLTKAGNYLDKLELDEKDLKWVLSTFLEKIEKQENLKELPIEDRKSYSDMILKSDEIDHDELADKVADDESRVYEEEDKKEICEECGSFTSFLESKGYTLESVLECGNEEMAANISEYANAHYEGLNEGDFENMSLYTNEEIIKELSEGYGHEDYVKQIEECGNKKIYESDEDKTQQITELWGGLKGVGKWAKDKAKDVGQKISDTAKQAFSRIESGFKTLSDDISKAWHEGEFEANKEGYINKINQTAEELGKIIDTYNKAAKKAGGEELSVKSIMATLRNQIGSEAGVDVRRGKTFKQDEAWDTNHVETQLNMKTDQNDILNEEDDEVEKELEKEKSEFSPDADILGMDVVKPESGSTDINVDAQNKNISISLQEQKIREYIRKRIKLIKEGERTLNESKGEALNKIDDMIREELKENKLRKYVRNRLKEMTGRKKPTLNEEKKSDKLKKLDKMIQEQFKLATKLHEGWSKKK